MNDESDDKNRRLASFRAAFEALPEEDQELMEELVSDLAEAEAQDRRDGFAEPSPGPHCRRVWEAAVDRLRARGVDASFASFFDKFVH